MDGGGRVGKEGEEGKKEVALETTGRCDVVGLGNKQHSVPPSSLTALSRDGSCYEPELRGVGQAKWATR